MEKISVIIVAAGSGTRMGSALPKQFMPLAGKPILLRSLEAMHEALPEAEIILSLRDPDIPLWEKIYADSGASVPHRTCAGGATRFESVRNAILQTEDADIILIHDGVRPLVTTKVVENVMEIVRRGVGAVPVVPCTDSIRFMVGQESVPMDRRNMRLVQTPQAFPAAQLREAYQQSFIPTFTDDATVVENNNKGKKVYTCDGDPRNIKITTPMDLALAEWILTHKDDGTLV